MSVLCACMCMAMHIYMYILGLYVYCITVTYCPLLGGCYVYNSPINLLQPAQGDKVPLWLGFVSKECDPVVRVCICVVLKFLLYNSILKHLITSRRRHMKYTM